VIAESLAALTLIGGANYADYHTSRDALRVPGAMEVNGIVGPSGERLAPVKIGAVLAESAVFLAMRRHHKRAAWMFVAGVVGVNLALAYHNRNVR
jgi:hypothetical protein